MIDAPPAARTILAPMPGADAILRQEPVGAIPSLGGILVRGNIDLGVEPARAESAVRTGVSGECVLCGMRLTGEELLALSRPPAAAGDPPKLARLRLAWTF